MRYIAGVIFFIFAVDLTSQNKMVMPFVFQISGALREFESRHAGKKGVDFSIGTPPTSPAIRMKQMELLFGTKKNPFPLDTPEAFLYAEMEKVVLDMGKYEVNGGRRDLRDRFGLLGNGLSATIVSGGVPKALELWGNLQNRFPACSGVMVTRNFSDLANMEENTLLILSTALMERSSLALFCGPREAVDALQSLHTALLGTPSAPQEDLYFLLSDKKVQKLLESGDFPENSSSTLTELWEFLLLLYREPLSVLHQKSLNLRDAFASQFFNCFFGRLSEESDFKIIAGNGGGRQALHIVEDFLARQGVENMILFEPHWTYGNVYTRTKLIALAVGDDGEPDFILLEEKFSELTKGGQQCNTALTINSPNNPTGVLYDQKTLEKLLILCEKYQIFLVDDACYIYILRDGEKSVPPVVEVASEMMKKGTLGVSFGKKIFVALTASKGLGMAGGRLGAILYRDENFQEVADEHYSHELANLLALFVANALTADADIFQHLLKTINAEVDRRVEKVTSILDQRKISYQKPAGAFYLEIKVPFLKEKVQDMKTFALKMAREKGIAFMPMEVFGGEKFAIRLSLGGEKSLTVLQEEISILLTSLMIEKGN